MTGPEPRPIDRAALEQIIKRATELQTGEREIGDNLSPDDVLQLGHDVGIPARYLQQAMLEHQAVTPAAADSQSVLGRVVGPGEVTSQRVVQGDPDDVMRSLLVWMEKNELLVVQRQQAGWVSWEPLRGMQAAIRRGTASLDTSKPKFMLSRADTVVATMTPLEQGYLHVTLSATVRQTRSSYLQGAVVSSMLGAGGALALGVLGAPALVVVIPLLPAGLITGTVLRRFRPVAERVQLGLERALDFLERGGIKPGHELPQKSPGLLEMLTQEVKRAITSGERRVDEAKRLRHRR